MGGSAFDTVPKQDNKGHTINNVAECLLIMHLSNKNAGTNRFTPVR